MDVKMKSKLDKEISTFFKHSPMESHDSFEHLTYSEFLSDKMLIIYIIRQGVPF